jgi:uncharacterized protein (TIGR03089 family)
MGGNASAGPTDTVAALVAALLAADPTRPVLTFYDDASGERTELSGVTLENWIAKTANLLVDGCGVGDRDEVAIWLPPHWQTAVILLACWRIGTTVAYGQPTAEAAAVEFASVEAVTGGAPATAADRFVLGLAPMGLPLRDAPPGWQDYIAEVRGHGDRYGGPPVSPDSVAMLDVSGAPVSQAALVAQGREHASRLGLEGGGRVLVDADAYPYPLDWLLAPLAIGSTLVLTTHTDPTKTEARATTEHATLVKGRSPH